MKKIVIILLFVTPGMSGLAQTRSIYNQTLNLYNNIAIGVVPTTVTVDNAMVTDLNDLFPGQNAIQIAELLNTNPFLTGKIHFSTVGSAGYVLLNSTLTSVENLNVTNPANAVASLMIDRAKQELTIAFFDRLKKFSKTTEFRTLFPKTADNLSNLLTYNYPQMLPALRDGFIEDLDQVTFNLAAVLELPRYQILLENYPEITICIQVLKLSQKLENGGTPDQVISDIKDAVAKIENSPAYNRTSIAFKNIIASFQFAQELSLSLRDQTGEHIWISGQQVNELVSNDIFTEIYLALLWQKVKNAGLKFYLDPANPGVSNDLSQLMATQKDNLLLFQQQLSQLLSYMTKAGGIYKTVKTKMAAGETITAEDYYNYIGTSINAIGYTLKIGKLFYPGLQSDPYMAIVTKSNNLYKDIYSKAYTQTISDALDIITVIQQLTKNAKTNGVKDDQHANEKLLVFATKIKPYAFFIANLAEAKDEKDIKSALNNAILPVGSS